MKKDTQHYELDLTRTEVCKLSLCITSLIFSMKDEMKDPECNEYRRDKVLPQSIAMWQSLHDKVNEQLKVQDMQQDWYTE